MGNTDIREALIKIVRERLIWATTAVQNSETPSLASLIVDDVLASPALGSIVTRASQNAESHHYEKALRDAITAVGEVDRFTGWGEQDLTSPEGEARLIDYQHAQAAIAALSKMGLSAFFPEEVSQ